MADPKQMQAPAPGASGSQITPDSVRASMKLPPNLEAPYERVITAGKKIMYSPVMDDQITQLLKAPGTVGHKLGTGATALVALMIQQSNHTMPGQLIIPAATELLVWFAQYLRSAGLKVSDNDIAEGMSEMVAQIMQAAGLSPDKLQAALAAQKNGPAPNPAAAGATPGGPPPAAPGPAGAGSPAGLIGNAMQGA